MKSIKEYINEAYQATYLKGWKPVEQLDKQYLTENKDDNIIKFIKDYALGVIDYFNQEGVIDWDENVIKQYVKGNKNPNYKDLVDEMIDELEEYGDKNNILPTLKEYEQNKIIIDKALFDAMSEYVKNILYI